MRWRSFSLVDLRGDVFSVITSGIIELDKEFRAVQHKLLERTPSWRTRKSFPEYAYVTARKIIFS